MIMNDYDEDFDILSIHWGKETKESIELFDNGLILDIDKNGKVVGLEIFNFMEEIRKHDKRMEKVFNLREVKK